MASIPGRTSAGGVVLSAVLLAVLQQTPVQCLECVGFPTTTTYPGGTGAVALAIADVNGDGKPDIVAATSNGALVMLGHGDGTFASGVTYGSGASSVAVADVNGDGRPDLALSSTASQAMIILLGNGDGTFGAPASFPSGIDQAAVALGDVDNDGHIDAVLVGGQGSTIGNRNLSILRGLGDGTFAAPVTGNSGTNPGGLLLADFNGDGSLDIASITGDHITHVSIELNDGHGGFTHSGSYNTSGLLVGLVTMAAGDFNNDHKIDLVVSHPTNILLGAGDGGFGSDRVQYTDGVAVAASDMNGDGNADVVLVNANGLVVLLGNGDGTLGPPATFASAAGATAVAVGDVNGDGRPDVVTADQAHTISIRLNAPGSCPPPLPSAPAVTSQPASQIVHAGQVVTWSATASGIPAPTVQWQYSANSGASWYDIAGATSTSYSFVASVGDSARQFRAIFTNNRGQATTTPAGLTVTSDRPFVADFDGDGRAELTIWRPADGTWYWLTSASGYDAEFAQGQQWGNQARGDVPLLADIDGDGKMDLIVWRATTGTWYWLTSSSGFNPAMAGTRQWGNASLGDIPLVGDLDGDGKAELVVWRASTGTWFWLSSRDGYSYGGQGQRQWGNQANGDVPMLGDLDGDGRADLVIWRAGFGQWFWVTSSSGFTAQNQRTLGDASRFDARFLADLDGDGRADLIVWTPSTGRWSWLTSSTNYADLSTLQWGREGDTPLAGDIDGDGIADFAVWRPATGTWFWLTSSSGWDASSARAVQWGSPTSGG